MIALIDVFIGAVIGYIIHRLYVFFTAKSSKKAKTVAKAKPKNPAIITKANPLDNIEL